MSITTFVEVQTDEARRVLLQHIADLPRVLGYAGKEIARQMRYDYMQPTRTWTRRPEVTSIVDVRAGEGLDVLVGTDDRIFTMLDRGTPPHVIFPKQPGGRLAFKWDGPGSYGAKTTPGSLKSQAARYPTTKVVRAWVLHPGTKPRGWSTLINEKWERQAAETLARYIERWAGS